MSEYIIQIDHVNKSFEKGSRTKDGTLREGVKVLDDVNINIKKGEFVTFLGPSGCGKTTLLRLIAGFLQPDEGGY